jgi:hypothetical protein
VTSVKHRRRQGAACSIRVDALFPLFHSPVDMLPTMAKLLSSKVNTQ